MQIYQQNELYLDSNFDNALALRTNRQKSEKHDLVDKSWCFVPDTELGQIYGMRKFPPPGQQHLGQLPPLKFTPGQNNLDFCPQEITPK